MDRNGNNVKNSLCGVETKQKSESARMGYKLTQASYYDKSI